MALHVLTGATGLIGSHVAEILIARKERVRALVRPGSDTRFLDALGVEVAPADLDVPATLPAALAGATIVYHCAARVGDWGPWSLYQQAILDVTRNLLAACRQAGVERFLHVSSINVYGHPRLKPDQWLTEEDPLGRNLWWWDYYCRAKILAEEEVRRYPGAWTIVRPSWTYGPRDRNSFPRVLKAIRRHRAMLLGSGNNRLNIIHAADIAEGIVRAASSPRGVNQAYNLSSEGAVSQKELLDLLTDELGLKRITFHLPFWLAFTAGFTAELIGRAIRKSTPPVLTRYAVSLLGRTTRFSIERARQHLGWEPRIHPFDGIRQTLAWYRQNQRPRTKPSCPTSPTA